MLRILHQAPCLDVLDIRFVCIGLTEVTAILKQSGRPVYRFTIILETIIVYNRELRMVSVSCEHEKSIRLSQHEIEDSMPTEKHLQQLFRGRKLLCPLMRRVRRFVPRVDVESLEPWIDAV